MGAWIDRLGETMLDAGLAAAALTGLAALLMVGCRQPSRRRDLARAALLGALALPPLTALGPIGPRLEVVRPIRAVVAPLRSTWPWPPRSSDLAAPSASPRIGRGLTLLYLAGASASLGWLALGFWAAGRLVRRSASPVEATLILYASLPTSGRRLPLRISARVRGPALLGLARPVIVIPPGLERPEARDHLRLGLLHELAHAERGDPRSGLVTGLARAVWFVIPWVWWIGRQLRLDQEFLADHQASGGFGAPGLYASSLVAQADLGGPGRVRPEPAPALKVGGGGSALLQRVLMLLRCPFRIESHPPPWWRWSLPPVVATSTLLASTLTLRSAETARAPAPGPNTLRIQRLVIAESPAGPDGWTLHHNLLVPLPPQFELDLDLWTDPLAMSRTRVAGQRLASSCPDSSDDPCWHRVQIERTTRGVRVLIDDQEVPTGPASADASTWLSVQPAPGRIGLFRNLVLTW